MKNCNPNSAFNFVSLIKQEGFDYIDFGCSKGGSLLFGERTFNGVKGLGIDCEQLKVDLTRDAGFAAVKFDIHDIPDEELVRFVVMSHFLEHVPDLNEVKAFIRKACLVSAEFVYIQQPYFDSDSYLARNGVKLFWSDWRGHPNRMTSLELLLILRDLRLEGIDINYSIHFKRRINDSADTRIHSVLSPIDQHEFNTNKHLEKPEKFVFSEPVYAETIVLITKHGTNHSEVLEKIKFDSTFIDDSGVVYDNHEISCSESNENRRSFMRRLIDVF